MASGADSIRAAAVQMNFMDGRDRNLEVVELIVRAREGKA
jgi:hypothetical protein